MILFSVFGWEWLTVKSLFFVNSLWRFKTVNWMILMSAFPLSTSIIYKILFRYTWAFLMLEISLIWWSQFLRMDMTIHLLMWFQNGPSCRVSILLLFCWLRYFAMWFIWYFPLFQIMSLLQFSLSIELKDVCVTALWYGVILMHEKLKDFDRDLKVYESRKRN